MNIYDKAHELARELKNSDEYRRYLQVKEVLEGDAQTKKMVQDFLDRQMEIEYEAVSGKRDQDKIEQAQKMYQLLSCNVCAREFLDNYLRFQKVMGDIYKILSDSVAEGLDIIVKR